MDKSIIELSLKRESHFDVVAPDGKKIFVYCNRAGDEPSEKAILIGHRLGGSPNGHIHIAARNYFTARGYDVYRMAFYWDEPDYRMLHECTVQIHADDYNAVLKKIRGSHKKLFACGHSYGGLTLVFANPKVDAISFWDPSYQPWDRFWSKSVIPAADNQTYLLKWEYYITVGAPMIDEAKAWTRDAAKLQTSHIKTPSQVIVAGDSWLKDDTQMLFDDLTCPKEYVTVEKAGHVFAEGQTVFDMLQKTHHWFEKY